MIREVQPKDIEEIYEMLKGNIDDLEMASVNDIYNNAKKFIVWDESGIKGCAYLLEYSKEKREWDMQVFVENKERRRGIGTALYIELQGILEASNPSVVITEFRVDSEDFGSFYRKFGYEKWYGSPSLCYRGSSQPKVDIELIPYEDKYYEKYAKCRQECFYDLRVKNDFKPYVISPSEEDRNYLLSVKGSTYIVLEDGNFIGAISVSNGYIDNLMVSPSFQGKGFGRKITQASINMELEKGNDKIYLCYIEGNEKADNLYKSLGFETLQNTYVYRRLSKR